MSQQKQKHWEPPSAPHCSPLQYPNPSLASCSAPCCAPTSGGCGSGSQRPRDQSPASPRRTRRKPRCISGGTTYHIKEEECPGISTLISDRFSLSFFDGQRNRGD
ncbi:hypothetical protein HPG69_010605 [Diceros bicornis minor]|uniref:Late cornified envelope protein 6A n=1 Tax=Diceros bicornis minor TaxID=77932 RepID=A0A7J7EKU4_DICBM|nr:hypothetical protein HPG69_010605 [Diceros bicornis minor]